MAQFQIFSDGSCDMALSDAEAKNIKIIPFYVSFDQEVYQKELFELPISDFYQKVLTEHVYPKTSLPSVQDYVNAFTEALERNQDIICFTITETLSGSYQSASTAKMMLLEQYPGANIHIVNSFLATGAQLLLLQEAVRIRDDGYSFTEAVKLLEELKESGRIFFMVGALRYLEKGGRIGKLASLSGKILNIKPLIELSHGEITNAGVAQSRKRGIKKLSTLTEAFFEKSQENPKNFIFTTGVTNTPEEIPGFAEQLQTFLPKENFLPPFQIGATIASHTGPETIGICLVKKYETLLS